MTHDNEKGRLFELLGHLQSAAPSARSEARIRSRAHQALARRHESIAIVASPRGVRLFDAGLAFVSITYLAVAIGEAVRLAIWR